MAANTLSILTPSVNNLTARIFVRAAGLDFEELDVWGKKDVPEFVEKDPAQLTPMLEAEGLPKGSLWESCAIMQYLCNKHDLGQFYPKDAGERAVVDSAVHRRCRPLDRRHSPGGHARVPARDRLRVPGLGQGVHDRGRDDTRRGLRGAGGGRTRLRRADEVAKCVNRDARGA